MFSVPFVGGGAYASVCFKGNPEVLRYSQYLASSPPSGARSLKPLTRPDSAQFQRLRQDGERRACSAPVHRLTNPSPTPARVCATSQLKSCTSKAETKCPFIDIVAGLQSRVCIKDGHSDILWERPQPFKGSPAFSIAADTWLLKSHRSIRWRCLYPVHHHFSLF